MGFPPLHNVAITGPERVGRSEKYDRVGNPETLDATTPATTHPPGPVTPSPRRSARECGAPAPTERAPPKDEASTARRWAGRPGTAGPAPLRARAPRRPRTR